MSPLRFLLSPFAGQIDARLDPREFWNHLVINVMWNHRGTVGQNR
jgi:hypothetical protein